MHPAPQSRVRAPRKREDAERRIRMLTQNVYDIGDEIAGLIDNLAEAMADWDVELVEDCLDELRSSIDTCRHEVRLNLATLNGFRQAYVSGIQSGTMSAVYSHPGRTMSFLTDAGSPPNTIEHATPRIDLSVLEDPSSGPGGRMASTAAWRLWLREESAELREPLAEIAEWVVEQTAQALDGGGVLLPQAFVRAGSAVERIAARWMEITATQPQLVRSMRGENPPEFLAERARVNSVVLRVMSRMRDVAG